MEHVVRYLDAAFLGQHEKGNDMGAGRIEVPVSVCGQGSPSSGPGIVVLRLGRVIDPLLDIREDFLVAGPQVTLGKRDAPVTNVPGIPVRRCIPRPVAHDRQVFLFPGREQEQHADAAKAFGCAGFGKVICNAANDLVRLRAVERPGLAVGPKHRNLHRDRLGPALDGELEQAIGCLRRGEDSAQLDARVDVLELLPVDRLDDLALLEFPGRGGRRTFLDVGDSNDEGRLE